MSGPYFHGTVILIGEKAVLITGVSGAGKSALAERMIAEARSQGRFAGLVGDDRVTVGASAGRLVVSGHPAIQGQIERRGIGIAEILWVSRAVLGAVVTLEADPPRLPDPESLFVEISGVRLPLLRMRADQDTAAKAHLALDWIAT